MTIYLQCMPAMWKACWSTGEERDKNKEEAIQHLTFLENEIKGGKFFGGDTIGLVDITANFIAHWFGIIAELMGVELITQDKFPNLSKWVDEYTNSNFVKENLPPKDKLVAFFKARIQAPHETKYFPMDLLQSTEVIGMAEVKLLGFWASPFSRRVEMALKLKGVEYEFIEENLSNKSELLLKYNPVHKKVPVLLHNGKPIAESLIIIEYIDQTWEGPSILPEDPYERAMARFWAKLLDEKCMPAMWKACWSTGEEQEKNKEEAIEHLTFLESELKGKKFFGGDTIGLVDITANFVAHWFGIIAELMGVELITQEKFPNLSKWVDEHANSSFVKENLPSKDKLVAFFKARIQAPDETKYFPKV
ncbi:hypothetical protein BUALT_BualtUnG0026400 [Buddleja alternifolia]|uniref:Probable glutathione S-transferase n=1 Tax=Buddleja alternifolia TaxID=168488 RepID=A0AAV6W7C7_9LAMI|nr:hypothetical protein BUALT_BualtUnG0026400 [Buddleja alternifolia]